MSELDVGFTIKNGIIAWPRGGCRPATTDEVILYDLLTRKKEKCMWEYESYNEWESGCGHLFDSGEEFGPYDFNYKFCPYCGREIGYVAMPCELCEQFDPERNECFACEMIHSPRCDDFKEVNVKQSKQEMNDGY